MNIDMNKKYKTRSGLPVRILCTNAGGKYPIAGLIDNKSVFQWLPNGRCAFSSQSDNDLIEVKEKKVMWVNVYKNGSTAVYLSRVHADDCQHAFGSGNRIACVKVEYEDGEGL